MKILMVTSSFDIGGAETHILELCRALSKKGVYVAVASFGGEYEKELALYGIRHYKINLISKNPTTLLSSYRKLKKLIAKERFNIVHSHARIPSLLCDIICKRIGIPFVTTAHWVFSTSFPKRELTRWGEKTLAVSEDIKDYLQDKYKLKNENIIVTRNGIDTKKFSCKDTNQKHIKICCVSRIDEGRAATAFSLLRIAPLIHDKYRNSEIIIIGSGNLYDELLKRANTSNELCGSNYVKILGKKTNVEDFLRDCDIFVGVSRAALEAMSCGKPVVLSGDEGYGGIFFANNAKNHILNNFCCRGEKGLSDNKLLRDILFLLSLTKEERYELGKVNREFILKSYSVDAMANDAFDVYKSLIKSPKVIVCGYYGYGNIGDELTLDATVTLLRENGINNITVLSATPKSTEKKYGVKSIHRYDFIGIGFCVKKCDVFMLGGGNLLQNQTSNRSLFYYGTVLKLAKEYGCECIAFSCGVGDLKGKWANDYARKLLFLCDYVFVRSSRDMQRVSCSFPKTNVIQSSDLVFLLETQNNTHKIKKRYFIIALREPISDRKKFIYEITNVINDFQKKYDIIPVFIEMHHQKDRKITRAVAKKCDNAITVPSVSTNRFLKLLSGAEFSVGMRLHLMIASVSCLIPTISLPFDTKIEDMYAHIEATAKSTGITPEKIIMRADISTLYQKMTDIQKSTSKSDIKRLKNALCKRTDNFKKHLENLFAL